MIRLTGRMASDGRLNWNAPPGRWTILRLGHTPTGARTKHGRPENLGLECDKLSVDAAAVQFNHYAGVILKEIRKVPGAKLAGVSMDSGEFGSQNWTDKFPEEFAAMNGYGLWNLLPAMAGYVVDSREKSNKFLYDVRRTIADLMAKNYYGTFQKLCHKEGMNFMAEAPGIATCMPSDNIAAKGRTDIPMGEFWMTQKIGTMDCKEAACAGHLYGKNIIAAESFTGSKADVSPEEMKPLADAAVSLGINRFDVLAYMLQPWNNRKPGVTENRFYLPYQRHNTWWNYSRSFWNTLARSCQMMQTGKPVIDVLYYLGNDTPLKIATWRMRPVPPKGYDYDVCSQESLLTTHVENGKIVLPNGMQYSLLILAQGNRLTVKAARHIAQLLRNGATVLATKRPVGTPGLDDGDSGDARIQAFADRFFPRGAGDTVEKRTCGKGSLILGEKPEAVLSSMNLPEDFETDSEGVHILYAHRRSAADDIYFVANPTAKAKKFYARFRVRNKCPQLWDPRTGSIVEADSCAETDNGCTILPLSLEAHGSIFVVFRNKPYPRTGSMLLTSAVPVWKHLDNPWHVTFLPGGGAPTHAMKWNSLHSWTDSPDPGIRDYSGTAIYSQDFVLKNIPEGKVIVDLGKVEVVARVYVNGKPVGTLWKAPYAIDITGKLRQGQNHITIKVANLWVNRLIADAGLPADRRISWETFNPYKPTDQMLTSGLLGPVVLRLTSARESAFVP